MPGSLMARRRLNDTLARIVVGPSMARGRLLVLEDIHWADTASLELLLHISARMADARLLIIATSRDRSVGSTNRRGDLFHQVLRSPYCCHIPLAPLTDSDVIDLVDRFTGWPESRDLGAHVQRKAQGNPFFVGETVRWLKSTRGAAASGYLADPGSIPIPDTIRVLIRDRLRALTPPTKALLTTASLLGEEFDFALLARARGTAASDVLLQLEEAVTARFITVNASRTSCQFVHALVRDVLYEDIPTAARAAMHEKVGEILRQQAGPLPDRFVNDLAFHYHRALPRAPEKAFEYCMRAGDAARAVLAYEQADAMYGRALEAWPFQTDGDQTRRCEALLGIAACRVTAGTAEKSLPQLEEAITLARALARPDLLAVCGALANLRVGPALRLDSTWDLTEDELKLVPDSLPTVRAYLLSRQASDTRLPVERRREQLMQAIRLVKASAPDPGMDRPTRTFLRAEVFRECLACFRGPDDLASCVQLATEIIEIANPDEAYCAYVAHHSRARARMVLGDFEPAREDVRRMTHLAASIRSSLLDFSMGTSEIRRLIGEGRFEDAGAKIEHMAKDSRHVVPHLRDSLRRLQTIDLRAERGDGFDDLVDDEFAQTGASTLVQLGFSESIPLSLCVTLAAAGRMDHARGVLAEFEACGVDALVQDDADLGILSAWALALISIPPLDRKRAMAVYERLRPYRRLSFVESGDLRYRAPVAYLLGLLARETGREGAAIDHFEEALPIAIAAGAAPMVIRVRLELVKALLGRDPTSSRIGPLIEEALSSSKALDMRSLCSELLALREIHSRGSLERLELA